MAALHDRLPVIVAAAQRAAWLKPQLLDPATLPHPYGEPEAWPVSRRAGDARREGPELPAGNA